ncbi:YhdT family protein [Photobacterium ganghwense]|uniref:YhdT family protein n=1 Tax=Photobacterium ganghwense TaxID=320778 RepID=UPI001A8CE720|nr:YhdT family protein [Photobacterium ganghwense]QSV13936.1 YhdT family protein [Photobacterium ganghwense]
MKTLSARYRQAHKEAKWALGLALAYFVWWYCTAYGFAPASTDTTMPPLYWGFPLWFLLACIIGPVIFTLLCALMVKFLYRDMPLDAEQETPHE